MHVTVDIVKMKGDFRTRLQISRQKIRRRHRNLKFEDSLDYTVRPCHNNGVGAGVVLYSGRGRQKKAHCRPHQACA